MKRLSEVRIQRWVAVVASAAILLGTAAMFGLFSFGGDYTLTRRVVGVPYEKALSEYVELLGQVDGILDAEYREYDPIRKTALVTVTYDPNVTNPRIFLVYFGHTESMWQKRVIA